MTKGPRQGARILKFTLALLFNGWLQKSQERSPKGKERLKCPRRGVILFRKHKLNLQIKACKHLLIQEEASNRSVGSPWHGRWSWSWKGLSHSSTPHFPWVRVWQALFSSDQEYETSITSRLMYKFLHAEFYMCCCYALVNPYQSIDSFTQYILAWCLGNLKKWMMPGCLTQTRSLALKTSHSTQGGAEIKVRKISRVRGEQSVGGGLLFW